MEVNSTPGKDSITNMNTSITSFLLSSDDFVDISKQANATAESLMEHLKGNNGASRAGSDSKDSLDSTIWYPSHLQSNSIGIMDLEIEGAFGEGSDQEKEFLAMALDSLNEMEHLRKQEKLKEQTHHPFSPPDDKRMTNNVIETQRLDQGKEVDHNKDNGDISGNVIKDFSPSSNSHGSVDASVITLELQAALRLAEMEVSQLHSQIYSKTHHLELAQRALIDYEEEVQLLNKQLKELSDDQSVSEPMSPEKKASCDTFVKDLWRVKSGTHRIRQSLGESTLWTDASIEYSEDIESERIVHKQQFEEMNNAYEKLKEQYKKLEEEHEISGVNYGSVCHQLEESKGKMQRLEEENRRLNKEKTKLKTQLTQAEEELLCVLQETPDVDEEVSTYRKRLKESQEQREVLLRDLECMKAELINLKAEIGMKEKLALLPLPPCKDNSKNQEQQVRKFQDKDQDKILYGHEALDCKSEIHGQLQDIENQGSDLHEKIRSLQEALKLALEANSLLEQKLENQEENASVIPKGLKIILEDIGQLKENFQRERRIALRERTENENIILNLQQEKEELIYQMRQVTIGLKELQEETTRVQNELEAKRKSAEEYKSKTEKQIFYLSKENEDLMFQLSKTREALDLCIEAKRILESRYPLQFYFDNKNVDKKMQEGENLSFTTVLRRKIQSGNDAQIKQAAIQAIEHLERINSQSVHSTSTCELSRQTSIEDGSVDELTDGSEMVTVTSHQLRMLRKELREMTKQRDEALCSYKAEKEKDTRRYNDIQALQKELNAALDQHEELLPKFREVLSSRKELEMKIQSLTKELERQKETQTEMEEAVIGLLSSCELILKDYWGSTESHFASSHSTCLLDSILTIKAEMDEFCNKSPKYDTRQKSHLWTEAPSSKHVTDEGDMYTNENHFSVSSSHTRTRDSDLKSIMANLKSMVDRERDLKKYFESQTLKLQTMKAENEPSSCLFSKEDKWNGEDKPEIETEFQLREKELVTNKIQDKDQEISHLFSELEQLRSGDEDFINVIGTLGHSYHHHHHCKKNIRAGGEQGQSSQNVEEHLSRYQDCAGMLEKQLIALKAENKDLRIEKRHLLKRVQTS